MSTKLEKTGCQKGIDEIRAHLTPYEAELASQMHAAGRMARTSLTPSQLSLLAATFRHIPAPKAILLPSSRKGAALFTDLTQTWDSFLTVNHRWHYISGPLTIQERDGDVTTRLNLAYHELLSNKDRRHHLVLPAAHLEAPLPDRSTYRAFTIVLTTGEDTLFGQLAATLVERGYVRHAASLEPGSFRLRGEHIDIAHIIHQGYFTITFHGNRIEKIVHTHNRRTRIVPSITLPPMKFPAAVQSWKSWLTNYLVFRPEHYAVEGKFTVITDSARPALSFPFAEDVVHPAAASKLLVFYQNRDRLDSYLRHRKPMTMYLCQNDLALHAIRLQGNGMTVVSEAAIFPPQQLPQESSPLSYERALELIGSLEAGRPAVHSDHGIGIYEGLQRRTVDHIEKEYIMVRYAQGDALSVPVDMAYKVSAYTGQSQPAIYRLGGTLWSKTLHQAKHDATRFAQELLDISRKRQQTARAPYQIKSQTDQELAAGFAYTLTPDQEKTWQEVAADLAGRQPMDRLVVGDVGYGKTEIAVRAARHVIDNGKQVAILAPTTLLVQQHYDTVRQRLPRQASSIYLLSRFTPTSQNRRTLQAIGDGTARIVIGTHALLSPKVMWQALGLVIIDEEQRFGVKQKEHFKKIRASVDILSLSATPIPRTLAMALAGLRSLSIINTPPAGRRSVKTSVNRVSDHLLTKAIDQELSRDGQVYVVAPKIRQLAAIKNRVQALYPRARIEIAHGRLADTKLGSIIEEFDAGQVDILVSSSIVENGLDLANVNTMIVWQAPYFGLSDLYQLRGRIGRRWRQGYAYFLYNQTDLTTIQRRRLAALTEASTLDQPGEGSSPGWTIARRDLEMRGAGNLLGAQQSGSAEAVGMQLYLDLINRAADSDPAGVETDIQLPLPTIIPIHYIQDPAVRTRWYQRIGRAKNDAQLDGYRQDLIARYGPLPAETQNLFLIVRLQKRAAQGGISRIHSKLITPPDEDPYQRLLVEGKNLPHIIGQLGELGRWVVRGSTMTLDIKDITPALIHRLTKLLLQKEHAPQV